MLFVDRADAGRRLAQRLQHLRGEEPVVLGLPRGGVPVAREVARALDAPLDIILVRKLGVPFQPELGMGAIGEDGVRVINRRAVEGAGVSAAALDHVEQRERAELERRARCFRADRPPVAPSGRTVVIVDDGMATGSTARAACQVARAHGAARVVLAVPVAPPNWTRRLADVADELISLATPGDFRAIGHFYEDFRQTFDEEVVACLEEAARPAPAAASTGLTDDPPVRLTDIDVEMPAGEVALAGHLTVPPDARGIVIFVHGSGSSRHSPRNRFVAAVLNEAGLGTLLFDLLTANEELDRANVFDIDLLASRLVAVTDWLRQQAAASGLGIGYFGASTGAAAALWAAAEPDASISAVVSRGGRPDLTAPRLTRVSAPTLLLVGGQDTGVLQLNQEAKARLHCENRLAVVPGATHLFEELGTLQEAAELTRDWFIGHMAPARNTGGRL